MVHEEIGDFFDLRRWDIIDKKGQDIDTTECGGFKLLGGYGQLSTQKLITSIDLSEYDFTMIKIEGVFHFIDAWSGQTAYLRLP